MTKIIWCNILKPSLSTSGPCWPSLGHVGLPRAVIMPSWCNRQELSWSMFAAVAILDPCCGMLGNLGSILHHPSTSWEAPWEPMGAKCSKSLRLRTRIRGTLGTWARLGGPLGAKKFKTTTPWAACWRQMFRFTAPVHKNEGAPRMPQRISESLREPDVRNHCACA